MRIPTPARFAMLLALGAVAGLSRPAGADDRELLYEKHPAPPNVMIVISNTTTMANVPGTATLAPLGGVDGTTSKMGQGKWALTEVVRKLAEQCANGQGGCINWGISSFDYSRADLAGGTKHFVFEPSADIVFPSAGFTIAANTKFNFGGAAYATVKLGGTNYNRIKWAGIGTVTDPANSPRTYVAATSPLTSLDADHLPIGGPNGQALVIITGIPSPTKPGGDPAWQMTAQITATSPSGIQPYSINRDTGQTFTVTFKTYNCTGTAPCDPTSTPVQSTVTPTFVVPPEYCKETDSTCYFPQIYGYGTTAQIGREMGWVSVPRLSSGQTVLDWNSNNSSGSADGWMQHFGTNPQPIVLIPHSDYSPWLPYQSGPMGQPASTQQTYPQDANPCIIRALRPTSSVLHISSSATTTYTESDNFPMWNSTKTPNNADSLDQHASCDLELDGYYQTGFSIIANPDDPSNPYKNASNNRMIAPIFPTLNGNVAPLTNTLKDAFGYFNGANQPNLSGTGCTMNSMVDNFCGAKRIDDPRKNCRNAAIILITDSFVQNKNVTQANVSPLAAINVPVYVIGFGVDSGDLGSTSYCQLADGSDANTGQCIAFWSGATVFSSNGVLQRQGYYTATTKDQLVAAITTISALLNEETRDFATATIPSVSATSEGVAYLSEFNPQNEHTIWSGHLRAFVLDKNSGQIQTTGAGFPLLTKYQFGTGSTAPTGSLLWDAGNTGQDARPGTNDIGVVGLLDTKVHVEPTLLLMTAPGPGGTWSDSTHDQADTSKPGRNLFFGLKPGEGGCGSTTYECLVQIPAGNGPSGTKSCPAPLSGCLNYPPVPDTTPPAWWQPVRDNSDPATQTIYANIPNPGNTPNPAVYPNGLTPRGTELGSGSTFDRDQALQNAFSFIRGNRDVVVEDLHISTKFGDPTQTETCSQLQGVTESPCYYDQALGDIFHSNPVIESFPSNTRYFLAQDPGTSNAGLYSDRSHSYRDFFTNYRHRRKILYAGANDGFLHAYDIGVYNGDTSCYTDPATGQNVCPTQNKYDLGSGREIFGYAPRAALQKFFYLAHATSQDWTLDGAPSVDDVYMDVGRVGKPPEGIASSDACGSPCTDISGTTPSWRTVLIGTEREGGIGTTPNGGGGSVFALDITDPDQSAHMTASDTGGHIGVPECLVGDFDPSSSSTPGGCSAPYPRILWEFRDDQATSSITPSPTEGGTEASVWDLGYTWSKPVIGRIKVKDTAANANHDFFVAIFGGGFRHTGTSLADTNTGGDSANYLYMIDIETGKVIYKRNIGVYSTVPSAPPSTGNLEAAVPGEPAVVDVNFDGYLDRIYFGDTQGRLWKVDLSTIPDFCSAAGTNCTSANYRISTSQWNPSLMFDEFADLVPSSGAREPIFVRPAVFLLGTSSTGEARLGIAFGTGDRDNMPILRDANPNYFVAIADDPSITYPLHLSDLTQASLTSNLCTGANDCFNGTGGGYYLPLPVDTVTGGDQIAEIVNADPLAFQQTLFFNTFLNNTQLVTGPDGSVQVGEGTCGEVGQARFYKINYQTGESLYTDPNGNVVASQSPAGAQVASNPIVYQGPNGQIWVVSATDDLKVPPIGGGGAPSVNIKSWKEQQ
jgi:Tfp pilus tip-associated adhesin PilY1